MLIMKINKRNRISKIFVDIAKDIIVNEGVQNVSVRKIADEAGYSYATIYNYYDDLNSLLWSVKKELIQELIVHMGNNPSKNLNDIKQLFHRYIAYYINYPNVFKFFYFYPLDISTDDIEHEFNFSLMWSKTFSGIMDEYQLNISDIQVISKCLIYSIHGLLMLHFNQNGSTNMKTISSDVDQIIDYLINRKGDL